MSNQANSPAEIEIDLVEVFKAIVRGRLPIAIALALSVALAAIYCFNFLPDVYSATTSLYVLNQIDQTVISSSDLSSSALLVNDYREIITSRRVTEAVAKGVAIGSGSHAFGTIKAFELGEAEGAMSSLAIAATGLMTVAAAPLFVLLF